MWMKVGLIAVHRKADSAVSAMVVFNTHIDGPLGLVGQPHATAPKTQESG